MRKSFLWLLTIILCIALLGTFSFIGCAQATQFEWETKYGTFKLSEKIAQKVANGEKLIFRTSTWDPTAPFFKDVRDGMKQAASDIGTDLIDVAMLGPVDGVVEKQVSELETLIQVEQVDGLAISCGEADVMIPLFDLAWKRGIPVVTYDNDSPESKRLAYVGMNQSEVGKASGNAFVKLHPQKEGKLAIFAAFPEAVYARGRIKAFKEILEQEGYNLEIVGPFKLGLDKAVGYSVVEDTFLANPDITAVYVTDEFVEVPALYIERQNLQSDVLCLGVNTLPGVLEHVQKGTIDHTVGVNPYAQGYETMVVLYEFITTGKTTEEIKFVDLEIVTPENIEEYLSKSK